MHCFQTYSSHKKEYFGELQQMKQEWTKIVIDRFLVNILEKFCFLNWILAIYPFINNFLNTMGGNLMASRNLLNRIETKEFAIDNYFVINQVCVCQVIKFTLLLLMDLFYIPVTHFRINWSGNDSKTCCDKSRNMTLVIKLILKAPSLYFRFIFPSFQTQVIFKYSNSYISILK